jgi:hypothetical protein
LPLENWTDLLPFVPRRQLVEIVKQLGDRQFARILQFFLTEVGQITFSHLCIVAPQENGGSPIVEVRKFCSEWGMRPPSDLETNLPEGPMPPNVKDFKIIELRFAIYMSAELSEFRNYRKFLGIIGNFLPLYFTVSPLFFSLLQRHAIFSMHFPSLSPK